MIDKKLYRIAGYSYFVIFFAAIFANFFVIESLLKNPEDTIAKHGIVVRLGILAFLLTVLFDVVVAWALNELFKAHYLTKLSTYFRLMHAAIMGVAVFSLPFVFKVEDANEILNQIEIFNTIWLIGLFFFGMHLILLGAILKKPKLISIFLVLAGVMYMVDTSAHFLLPNYEDNKSIFLLLVAVPSIFGEMSFAVWLIIRSFNKNTD